MNRWTTAGFLTAVLAAAALVAPSSAGAADEPDVWSSENGGPGNAAINLGETALTPAAAADATRRWTRSDVTGVRGAPTVVDGVGYQVLNPRTDTQPATFEAFSVRTGDAIWTIPLPRDGRYPYGLSVQGTVAVMSFDGQTRAGGVTAVGLTSRRVLWSQRQTVAPQAAAAVNAKVAGPVVVDFERVYLLGGVATVTTYALSDGTPGWRVATKPVPPTGIATGNGIVYTGGRSGVVAYDSANGRRLWTAPGVGAPVRAGGRVVTAAGNRLVAVPASGCGASRCDALWDVTLPYPNMTGTAVGGLDDTNGYLAYTDSGTGDGGLVRFGAVTGRVLWRAPVAGGGARPVRNGTTVWTVGGGDTLLGFSTTATRGKPLVSIAEPQVGQGDDQQLAIAAGRVLVRTAPRGLVAYG